MNVQDQKLEARIRELEAQLSDWIDSCQEKWLSVQTNPPPEHIEVLIYSPIYGRMAAIRKPSGWYNAHSAAHYEHVTHWMHLPPKPVQR